jgi:cyclopropane-fatty-acyl-phospholipid synthase
MKTLIDLIESGIVPDALIRAGIPAPNRKRLREKHRGGIDALRAHQCAIVTMLRNSPIAVRTDAANEQHYEALSEFFNPARGRHRRYSCCYCPTGRDSLDDAEE